MEKRTKLAVCWIWQSPFVWTKSVESMLRLRHPEGFEVAFFRGEGWCPAIRHISACEQAVAWDAEHIVILGADQVYEPDLLERLIARRYNDGCEVIAALVPTRGYLAQEGMRPFQPMAWRIRTNGTDAVQWKSDRSHLEIIDPVAGDLQKIDYIGSGCIMFDTDHLLALGRPWFFETIDPLTQKRIACMDTKFCHRLRLEAFAQVWCDTTIKIKHVHDMAIDDSFQHRFDDWMTEGNGDPAICRFGEDKIVSAAPASAIEPGGASSAGDTRAIGPADDASTAGQPQTS